MRTPLAFDRVEHDRGREQLGQNHRLGFTGLPDDVKRDGAALIFRELGGDGWVFVGPVGAQGDDFFRSKSAEDGVGVEDDFLIRLARGAPTRREIDVDGFPLGAELRDGFGAPFFPDDFGRAGGLGSGGSQGPPQPNRLFMKVIFSEVIFSLNCNAME